MTTKPTPRTYTAIPLRVLAYDCCECQRQHTALDPLYRAHLARQSKHGLRPVPVVGHFYVD